MNTIFLLLAEFGTGEIPLAEVAPKYFGLDSRKAFDKARTQTLPVPGLQGLAPHQQRGFIPMSKYAIALLLAITSTAATADVRCHKWGEMGPSAPIYIFKGSQCPVGYYPA